jgi:hypothetical protein
MSDTIFVLYTADEKKRNFSSSTQNGSGVCEMTAAQFVLENARDLHCHVSRKVPAAVAGQQQADGEREMTYEKIVVIKVIYFMNKMF